MIDASKIGKRFLIRRKLERRGGPAPFALPREAPIDVELLEVSADSDGNVLGFSLVRDLQVNESFWIEESLYDVLTELPMSEPMKERMRAKLMQTMLFAMRKMYDDHLCSKCGRRLGEHGFVTQTCPSPPTPSPAP